MIRSIKELKREMDARVREDELERDEEGRAIIEVTVRQDVDFLSDYSVERPMISSSFSDFLREQAEAFPPREPILLKIHSNCIDEGEKGVYGAALKEYAMRNYKKHTLDLKKNGLISAILMAVGVLGLAAVVILSFFSNNAVLAEILDIFAWVFVWEAVDLFFLERRIIRAQLHRCLRLYEAKIQFLPLQNEENQGL